MKSYSVFLDKINDVASSILSSKYFKYISFSLILIVIFRGLYYIDNYAVNLLTKDEWGFYTPYFDHYSFLKTYIHQHGPHRQGLGSLVIYLNNNLTGWNNRILGFVNFGLVLISPVIYLIIKKKHLKELTSTDSLIFLITLLPAQFAVFTNTPNTAHGPMPALLISLLCLSFYAKNLLIRNFLIILINFNMVFTGFGYFVGILVPLIFVGEIFWFRANKDYRKMAISLVSVLMALLTIYLFFQNYRTDAPSSKFSFPYSKPWEYIYFIALCYSNLFGANGINLINIILGLIIVSLLTFIFIRQAIALAKQSFDPDNPEIKLRKVVIILIGFSLLFTAGTAVGRIHSGLHMAQASRYMPYIIPSIIGIYLYLISIKVKYKPIYLLAFFVIGITGSAITGKIQTSMKTYAKKKTDWVKAYKESESITNANKTARFEIHPKPERVKLKEKLDYLKTNELNFFHDNTLKE